ncbi:MAG: GIY-YIG nuclease family protein [Asgard group archaeon]|nr:GIY-YIG nuclease family protein [Asgard group archaeon]
MKYFVYMVVCSDGTLYTGYTTNLSERIKQHNSNSQGAKYTRTRQPVKLAYYEIKNNQRNAMRREREIKRLTRSEKLKLIEDFRNNL